VYVKTLDEALEIARDQGAAREDMLAPVGNIVMDEEGRLHANDGTYATTPALPQRQAMQHMATFFKGTSRYPLAKHIGKTVDYLMEDLPPHLRADNVNYWLGRMPRGTRLLLRNYPYGGGDMVTRAVCSSSYATVDPDHLVEYTHRAFQKTGHGNLGLGNSATITPDILHMRITVPGIERVIDAGNYRQVHRAGIYISTGAVKNRKILVAPFIQGISCENSTVFFTDDFGFEHKHVNMNPQFAANFVYAAIGRCVAAAPEVLENMAQMARAEIEDPADIIARIVKEMGLETGAEGDIHQAMWNQGGATVLGLSNAITYYAHTSGVPDDKRVELELLGGNVIMAGPDNLFTQALKLRATGED
jgi:hypothetical protein